MKKIKFLFFVFSYVLFLSACDSSGTQEESPTVASSTQPDDPNFRISVITPVTTITTSYSPDYVFYSNRSGFISYNGYCVGNLTEAVVGNNTMKIYSASSTPPVYIPLSSGHMTFQQSEWGGPRRIRGFSGWFPFPLIRPSGTLSLEGESFPWLFWNSGFCNSG